MSKGGTQVTNTQADAGTRAFAEEARKRALAASSQPYRGFDPSRAVAGLDPAQIAATQNYGQYANFGLRGLNALTGGDASPFLNPYMSNLDSIFGNLREGALNSVNEQATRARAFGGSRQGVASGQALADIARQEGGARIGAFDAAMGRAGQAAGLGLEANAGYAAGGAAGQEVEQRRRAAELARFMEERGWDASQLGLLTPFLTPTGQETMTKTPGDFWSTALGIGGLLIPGLGIPGFLGGQGADKIMKSVLNK